MPATNGGAPSEPAEKPASGEAAPPDGQVRIALPSFEGPLDLLLHLIQKHELDILDIPVGFVTEKYLEYLSVMRALSIDVASEYLVMAATLAHIKSKMLLPAAPPDQDEALPGEEVDPREELVRRLLEYQKYKTAAADLLERGTLGSEVFPRGATEEVPSGPAPFAPVPVFALLDAFQKVLERSKVRLEHEVVFDRIGITDRIVQLTEALRGRRAATFEDLLGVGTEAGAAAGERRRAPSRFDLVITFLALLEMARTRLIRIYQADPLAEIHVELAIVDDPPPDEAGPAQATEGFPS